MEGRLGLVITSILIIAFLTLFLVLLNWLWFKPKKLEKLLRQQGLKGNPYRPVFGDLNDYISAITQEWQKSISLSDELIPHIFPYYHQCISKHGQNSFMWFGPWPRLNITDPHLINEILKRSDVFHKPFPELVRAMTGGLTALEGEKWTKHRKIVTPAFQMEKLKNMAPTMAQCCSEMIAKWKAIVSSSEKGCRYCEIDVWPYLEDVAADVISRTAFGSSHEEGKRVFQLLKENLKLTFQLSKVSFIPGWRHLPMAAVRRTKAIQQEVEARLRDIIEKRQKAMQIQGTFSCDDLLGTLLDSNFKLIEEDEHKDAGMSIEDVIEECRLFYLSGSDSSATLLVWTMVLLCKHPEWQTRARDEVMQVYGNAEPNYEGLNRLKIVNMILQEALRLYSPAPQTIRSTTKTVKIGDLTIPAGVHLGLLIGMLHYDSKIWGDHVKEFNPQRFSEGVSNAANSQFSFIPFGGGPRICLGQNFVMTEAKLTFAMILQSFSFELSPSYMHAPFSTVTLTPQYGTPLILRRLQPISHY